MEIFFYGIPHGKVTGFCQPTNSSIYKDGGLVVDIPVDCIKCSVHKCMMFENVYDKDGKFIGKRYTPHLPQYSK